MKQNFKNNVAELLEHNIADQHTQFKWIINNQVHLDNKFLIC